MTVIKRKTMCKECPWRKASSPGWLGASSADDFVRTNDRAEGDMPCHMEVNYGDPHWADKLPTTATCVGGHHFNANTSKLPIRPDMREALDTYGPNPEVFDSFQEFLAHHDNDRNRTYVAMHQEHEEQRNG